MVDDTKEVSNIVFNVIIPFSEKLLTLLYKIWHHYLLGEASSPFLFFSWPGVYLMMSDVDSRNK